MLGVRTSKVEQERASTRVKSRPALNNFENNRCDRELKIIPE